jgi:hypothetical protein
VNCAYAGDHHQRDELLEVVIWIGVCRIEGLQDKLSKSYTVSGPMGEEDEEERDNDDGEVFWPRVGFVDLEWMLELNYTRREMTYINDFATREWKGNPQLYIYYKSVTS